MVDRLELAISDDAVELCREARVQMIRMREALRPFARVAQAFPFDEVEDDEDLEIKSISGGRWRLGADRFLDARDAINALHTDDPSDSGGGDG